MTIIPIGFSAMTYVMAKWIWDKEWPTYNHNFGVGVLLLLPGFIFFKLGLDDENDWCRLNHNLWHFFVALAFIFFAECVDENCHPIAVHKNLVCDDS